MFLTGTYYTHAAMGMAALIRSSYPSSVSHVDLYTSLGRRMPLALLSMFVVVAALLQKSHLPQPTASSKSRNELILFSVVFKYLFVGLAG
jgi:hypothetical protein